MPKKKWLITGATGQLGMHLLNIQLNLPEPSPKITCVSKSAGMVLGHSVEVLDLTDLASLHRKLRELQPDVIIHLAGVSSPNAAEQHPEVAAAIHWHATREMAEYASKTGAWVLLASTDYVYAGDAETAYRECDHAEPRMVYGKTKLAGEREILEREVGAVCRFGFLWGESLKSGPGGWSGVKQKLSDGETVVGVVDEIRSPLRLTRAAQVILMLQAQRFCGVVNVGGDEPASPYDVIRQYRKELGSTSTIIPIQRNKYSPNFARPANVALDISRLISLTSASQVSWSASVDRRPLDLLQAD